MKDRLKEMVEITADYFIRDMEMRTTIDQLRKSNREKEDRITKEKG